MTISLYRKYRPARFEDIIGQEHVTRTLINAIKQDHVSHAYLFTGPRGTGKTSTAKILAMALNCEAGKGEATPTPDGTCPQCEAIRRGSSLDVVEMDAASNRGIDDIRDLRDKVHFAPVEGRMKVYIVDEVHMLTPEAFNALLKTLEEPPAHAVFVLATTEPHKVPATILSRCQRFDFRRPALPEVVQVLSKIAQQEGIEVAEPSLTVIARAAAGSFRDAIGTLDQLATYCGGHISLQETLNLLGIVQRDLLFEIVDIVNEYDTQGALLFVERLNQAGTDYTQFAKDLLSYLRDMYVIKHTVEAPPSLALSQEQLEELLGQAQRVPTARIVTFVDLLGEALRAVRQGSEPRLELELVLIKMTALAAGEGKRPEETAPPPRPAREPTTSAAAASPEPKEAAIPADLDHLRRAWTVVIDTLKTKQAGLAVVLAEGRPESLAGDELVIRFPAGCAFQASQVARGDNPRVIAGVLQQLTGRALRVVAHVAEEPETSPAPVKEDARILSKEELLRVLKQEFDAQIIDEGPAR